MLKAISKIKKWWKRVYKRLFLIKSASVVLQKYMRGYNVCNSTRLYHKFRKCLKELDYFDGLKEQIYNDSVCYIAYRFRKHKKEVKRREEMKEKERIRIENENKMKNKKTNKVSKFVSKKSKSKNFI